MMVNVNGVVQSGNMVQSQLFLPPTVSQGNPNIGRPPLSAHMLNKVFRLDNSVWNISIYIVFTNTLIIKGRGRNQTGTKSVASLFANST